MISVGIPSGSRQDFGCQYFSSRQESRRDPGKILAGKQNLTKISLGSCRESRQDSRQEAKILVAKILPGSCCESRQDSRREAKISAAKIWARSCRESRQDSRWEAIIPPAKISLECYCESRQDSRRRANSRWQKSLRDLAGNPAKIGDRKFKFKFKFIYSHLFNYDLTKTRDRNEVKNRTDYTLS